MMASGGVLTANAVLDIHNELSPESPIVQILDVKTIKTQSPDGSKPDRYRLQISDGEHKHLSAMLATQMNSLVTEGQIQKNAIVRLLKYVCNTVNNRRIIIIINAEVINPDLGHRIGNPTNVGKDKQEQPAAAPAPDQAAADIKPDVSKPASTKPYPIAAQRTSPANPYQRRRESYGQVAGDGPMASGYVPISSMTPYMSRWTIRVRITNKPPIKTYSNAKGEGKLFNVDLLDESGALRATGFNEACDRLYDTLEVGKVYLVRGGRLRASNPRFSTIKNDYELSMDESTTFTLDSSDTTGLPQQKYDFKSFDELAAMDVENLFCDVLAVIVEVGELATIITKSTGKELIKREVTLMDSGATRLRCTLWASQAESFETSGGVPGVVMAVKSARVSDFNGRSLSVSSGSTMLLNPDIEEAHALKGWYDSEGSSMEGKTLTVTRVGKDPRIFVGQIKEDKIGLVDGKQEYFMLKGTVTFIRKENCMYNACPSDKCNKKVVDEGMGQWRCEKCNQVYENFNYRLMMSVSFTDATGQVWVTAFQDVAEKILGETSQTLGELKDTNEAAFDEKISAATFKSYLFKCRAKADTWNEETRVRVTAMDCFQIDFANESRHLVEQIKAYM